MRPSGMAGTGGTGGGGGGGGAGGALQLGELRKAAAAAGKLIGAAVDGVALRDDPTYAAVLAREFDYVTPENATKWGPLAPTAGSYDWAAADAIVDAAAAQAQAVKGHALVWHQQTPSWVTDAMTADELGAALKAHIEATLAHFRGRMRAWDVVNEAIDVSHRVRLQGEHLLAEARAALHRGRVSLGARRGSDVLLFYNDFAIERLGAKSDATYALMRDLLAARDAHRRDRVPVAPLDPPLSGGRRPARQLSPLRRAGPARERQRARRAHAADAWLAGQPLAGAAASRSSRWWAPAWSSRRARRSRSGDSPTSTPGSTTTPIPTIRCRSIAATCRSPLTTGSWTGWRACCRSAATTWSATETSRPAPTAGAVSGGVLAVEAADGRDGSAACVSGRTDVRHGPTQAGLLDRLSAGGPLSSRPGRGCAARAPRNVIAELVVTESAAEPRLVNVSSRVAADGGWVELTGAISLGFTATPVAPTSIDFQISGLQPASSCASPASSCDLFRPADPKQRARLRRAVRARRGSMRHMIAGLVSIDSPCRAYSGNTTRSMFGIPRRAFAVRSQMRRHWAARSSGVTTFGFCSCTRPSTTPPGDLLRPPSPFMAWQYRTDGRCLHRAIGDYAKNLRAADAAETVARGARVVAIGVLP